MQNKKLSVCGVVLSVCLASACGKGINGGPVITLNPILAAAPPTGATSVASFMGRSLFESLYHLDAQVKSQVAALYVGAATASQLKELKYFIIDIKICESLTSSGTAYSNPTNCSTLYKSTNTSIDETSGSTYTIAQAAADTDPGHYLDLVDMATTKAKINSGVTVNPGTYNFGVINYAQVVKFKAEITLNNGSTIVTRSALTQVGSHLQPSTTLVGAAGTAEESMVTMGNSGTFFKFQTPFVYDGSNEAIIDLVFNPDSVVQGSSSASNFQIQEANNGNAINVPIVSLSPVVHTSGDTAMKEIYVVTGPNATNLRVELYYLKSDPIKAVYGVDMRQLYSPTSAAIAFPPTQIKSVTVNADQSLNFNDWQGVSILPGFKRLTAKGATGNVTLGCSSVLAGGFFCVSGQSTSSADIPTTYTLIDTVQVQ